MGSKLISKEIIEKKDFEKLKVTVSKCLKVSKN
jgi:hypothetical protein